jgi:hypothetical protein
MINPILASITGTTSFTGTSVAWVLSFSGALPQSATDTTVYPSDVMVFNSTGAATLKLPPVGPLSYPSTGDGLAVGKNMALTLVNLGSAITLSGATGSNTFAGIASPTALGATHGVAYLVADPDNARWIRMY